MKELDFESDDLYHRVLCHGRSGTGKTRFGGTWPGLVAFCPKSEGGSTTLRTMKKEDFYDGERPRVYEIDSMDDVKKIPSVAAAAVKAGARTIAIDSLTYTALILQKEIRGDDQRAWGVLLKMTHDLRDALHALDAHILWMAGSETDKKKVLVPGQTAQYIQHSMSFIFYHDVQVVDGAANYLVHTNPSSGYLARTRLNDIIPSPLTMLVEDPQSETGYSRVNSPTYRAIEQALQLRAS